MKATRVRSRSPVFILCRDGHSLNPALFSGTARYMVGFCQFPDLALGRADVRRRIWGTQVRAARDAQYAYPRRRAGVPEQAHASTLVVTVFIMSSLPLVSHVSPDSIVAWRVDGAVSLHQFLT